MTFQSRFLRCAGREIHFTEWGAADAPVVVMWHGLTRTGRDFDEAAAALSETRRVICPDTPGRGFSEWLPAKEYTLAVYAGIAQALLDELGIEKCDWVGTSMGGLLGIHLAAGPLRGRIRRMVINDIGPTIPLAAMARIAKFAMKPKRFDRASQFAAWLRETYEPFVQAPDTYWERMAHTSCRRLPDGRWTTHYDPAIVRPFSTAVTGLNMWAEYDSLDCPVLLLRGANSDVLPQKTAEAMTERGPQARLVVIPDCGHAPSLATPEQLALLREACGVIITNVEQSA